MRLATSASIVRRAAIVALIVGTVLVAINHGDAIVRGDVSPGRALRILLTVLVPYCVSTYSSVSAIRMATRMRPSPDTKASTRASTPSRTRQFFTYL
jgi:hypothetical protein